MRKVNQATAALCCALGMMGTSLIVSTANAKPPRKKAESGGSTKAQVTELVSKFELAYARKDKTTMITKLMTPNPDDLMVEKRFQWLRGYGPKDMPGSRHPPILFERPRGTFVPKSYLIRTVTPGDSTHYEVSVQEKGIYTDEDGKYKVERIRKIKCQKVSNKWYIEDYPAPTDDDLGFGVDDISDKMTKI